MSDGRWQATRMVRQHRGVPVYEYRTDPATPPVSVLRLGPLTPSDLEYQHIHDFPLLIYVRTEAVVYVVAPGQVIDTDGIALPDSSTTIFFDPDALGGRARGAWPTWRRHPLLSPFLHARRGGLLRVELPAEHDLWEHEMTAIETELEHRRAGYREAVLARLTLLLIELARLTSDIVGGLRDIGEPLLARVFEVIDERYADVLSLRDVAAAVGVTPGHLTTVVRRRTGRTVQDWIIERRMAAARELLADSDMPISEVAHRVGLPDPAYFARVFRRAHDLSPRDWRNRLPRTDA
ncbi:helix-turn-helix transcriptional regulator [Nocardia bovistercoris]|uniref:Helix-turn-helix transcriptional regulator n=1 Tax=Nocardia bovistercoris TaxID=2785916 RepID=A0A931IC86_9NOCA|nr:AraC family transcriptional regulator [Nocardia bovistercoris]MBH0777886.1 helix-turn-helix transcriptional regulator [Nocardia bovistercoris]